MDFEKLPKKEFLQLIYKKVQASELTEEYKIMDGKIERVYHPGDMLVYTDGHAILMERWVFDKKFKLIQEANVYPDLIDNSDKLLAENNVIIYNEEKEDLSNL